MTPSDLLDVQELVARGFGHLSCARFLVLRIDDSGGARRWLANQLARVSWAASPRTSSTIQIAISANGLRALGVNPESGREGSAEFSEGMSAARRSRVLGDVGSNAPEHWLWGAGAARADLWLGLYAEGREALDGLEAQLDIGGAVVEIARIDSDLLPEGREHFGFRDGVSQPVLDSWARADTGWDRISDGEVLLGHPNAYGERAQGISLPASADPGGHLPRNEHGEADLGKNGSFLVVRVLEQDVSAFWKFVDAAVLAADAPASRVSERERIAARLVGRWRSGCPVTLSPERDDPTLADANSFGYHAKDPDGLGCPVGSHVRRSHPRDMLGLQPGTDAARRASNLHRILRRGRPYGPPLARSLEPEDLVRVEPDGVPRGLHFACLNSNLRRQFEFIQQMWCNNEKFGNLHESVDPLIGSRSDAPGTSAATFTIPELPIRRRLHDLPRFVSMRGGEYFLLPSRRALQYLSSEVRNDA